MRARLASARGRHHEQETALHDIAALAQHALQRLGEAGAGRGDPGPSPAPTVTDRSRLIEGSRSGGQRVEATIPPAASPVPGPLGTAVHRIAGDSLGNARRHALGSGVRLRIHIDEARIELLAVNRMSSQPPSLAPGARGLWGMAESARATGGRLSAGPSGDRWEVRAEWPRGVPAVAR